MFPVVWEHVITDKVRRDGTEEDLFRSEVVQLLHLLVDTS